MAYGLSIAKILDVKMRIRDSFRFLALLALVSIPLANAFAQKQSIEAKLLDNI